MRGHSFSRNFAPRFPENKLEWEHQPASQQTKTFLHYYASLESFLKAKWQMMRRPKRSTIRTDVYEIRPRADKDGVDLVSDALPYSPMWYRGPTAITDAMDHAKFFSRSHDAVIRVYDEEGNLIETQAARGRFQRVVSDFPSFSLPVMTPSAANADGPYHLFLLRDSIILMLRVRQKSVAGHEYERLNIGARITRG